LWNRNLETQEERRERVALAKQGLTHLQIDSMFERRHIDAEKEIKAQEIAETTKELEIVEAELAKARIEEKKAILEILSDNMDSIVEERNMIEHILLQVRKGLDRHHSMLVIFENQDTGKGSIKVGIFGANLEMDDFFDKEKRLSEEKSKLEVIDGRILCTYKEDLVPEKEENEE